MSVVSAVTLIVGSMDEFDTRPNHEPPVNRWLRERYFGPLVDVSNAYGGSKTPGCHVYGGGYNGFPEDAFAAFVLSCAWESPEELVIVIHPEEGMARVFRPLEVTLGQHEIPDHYEVAEEARDHAEWLEAERVRAAKAGGW